MRYVDLAIVLKKTALCSDTLSRSVNMYWSFRGPCLLRSGVVQEQWPVVSNDNHRKYVILELHYVGQAAQSL